MITTYIDTDQDVATLIKEVRTGKRRQIGKVQVRLNGLEKEMADKLSNEINKHYYACGCREATALGLGGFGLAIIWMATQLESWRSISWRDGLILAFVFIISTGFGKAIGQWRARTALISAINKLILFAPSTLEIGKGDGPEQCSINGPADQ